MQARYKKILLTTAAIVVGIPAVVIALANTPPGRSIISSVASNASGRDVQFSGFIYPRNPILTSWHISDLSVTNMGGAKHPQMADIGKLNATLGLRGGLGIKRLALIDSEVNLERNAKGDANWTSDKPKDDNAETTLPKLGHIYIENSTLTYIDALQKSDLIIRARTEGESFKLQGEGVHQGQKFALNGDVLSTCFKDSAKSCPLSAELAVGHTTVKATGTLTELVPPKGADFALDIKGADAAELFPLFGIVLPPTAPYQLAGRVTWENERWHFDDFTGRMGQSDISGSALWDPTGVRPKLRATLVSQQVRLEDLGPLIGIAPKQRISQDQIIRGAKQDAAPTIIPDIPLDITKISSMDADVEFTGKKVVSDALPLDDFFLKLTLNDRLMKMEPLRFGTAKGNVSAYITTNAREMPVQQSADVKFNKLTLAGIFGNAGKSLGAEPPEGFIGGTIKLRGTGKSMREVLSNADGVAGLGMEGGKISELLLKLMSLDVVRSLGFILTGDKVMNIRCVVGTFDLNDGILTADQLVIDTDTTNVKGKGTINLGDERMELTLVPAPKEPTLLSLRSPIDVNGTFKEPDVSIQKGPLAIRGGIAAGLAALAPVAAAAAFFEGGVGEDSDCAALINHLNQKTGTTKKTDGVPNNK